MIKNRTRFGILILSFSVALTTILILSGSKTLIYGLIQNEDNTKNNNNNTNKSYNTTLSGSQQVPPVKTNAIGTASFELLNDYKTIHYQINILDEKNLILLLPPQQSYLRFISIFTILFLFLFSFFCISGFTISYSDNNNNQTNHEELMGVDMKGMYTSLNYERFPNITITSDYYDDSFKLIKNIGMNHVRYVLYWEAYEKNPTLFLKELENVANLADKWGLRMIYDNHQFHTSSWLDNKRGTGFPSFFFDKHLYPIDSGITTTASNSTTTGVWWTNWWNRNITDQENKVDGWTLQAHFLKTLVKLLDTHNSTKGYEILNEPQVFSTDQWPKIGKYYEYMLK